MKAKLIFNLPEENHEWKNAIDGSSMRSTLWEYDQWLRSVIKHEDLNEEQYKIYKECRNKLREMLIENNVDIDS
jgi:hypothetical protein